MIRNNIPADNTRNIATYCHINLQKCSTYTHILVTRVERDVLQHAGSIRQLVLVLVLARKHQPDVGRLGSA